MRLSPGCIHGGRIAIPAVPTTSQADRPGAGPSVASQGGRLDGLQRLGQPPWSKASGCRGGKGAPKGPRLPSQGQEPAQLGAVPQVPRRRPRQRAPEHPMSYVGRGSLKRGLWKGVS